MNTASDILTEKRSGDSLHWAGSDVRSESRELEQHSLSIFWYAVGVWQRFAALTHEQRKEAGQKASDALACDSALAIADGTVEIPHFGKCSGHKATAIMCCFIVSAAKTNHLDSPFLRAAREAKKLAELKGDQ